VVLDVAVLSAIGIGPDECRWVLGVSCTLSEAEVHCGGPSLKACLSVVCDLWSPYDHSGLKAAREAVFGGCVATLPVPSGAERPFIISPERKSVNTLVLN